MYGNFQRAAVTAGILCACAAFSAPASAGCVFGTPFGGEPTLQVALDQILAPAPDTAGACLADGPEGDAYWTSTGGTSATIMLEIAGYANVNSFGLYDSADPTNRLQIFIGAADPGTRAQLTFDSNGQITVSYGAHVVRRARFTGPAFGFYLLTGEGNRLMSDSSLNSGGVDRMYAYLGNGARFTSGPIVTDGNPANDIFGAGDAILAYEDLLVGDNDFQDFVVLVRGVQPVPLPAGAWLLGSACIGWWLHRRRRGVEPLMT